MGWGKKKKVIDPNSICVYVSNYHLNDNYKTKIKNILYKCKGTDNYNVISIGAEYYIDETNATSKVWIKLDEPYNLIGNTLTINLNKKLHDRIEEDKKTHQRLKSIEKIKRRMNGETPKKYTNTPFSRKERIINYLLKFLKI